MDDASREAGGMLATGRRMLGTLYDLAQNRLELFLLELREERLRVFDAILLVAVGVVCALMTLGLLTFALVVIFWEYKVLVSVLLMLGYAGGAGGAFWALRQRLQRWQSFSASLEQFKKDSACLQKTN
ncbi:MAG: phage holin family protein [Verrucomicrobia bacterium]|nr:phage holin family protein [Verrucomicrobiota bacterium]